MRTTLIILLVGVILYYYFPVSKKQTQLSQTISPHCGKIVYLSDAPDKIGLVMEQFADGDILVWWQDMINYNPYEPPVFGKHKYYYASKDLVVADATILATQIYYRPNNTVRESLVIGKYICSNLSNCLECHIIYAYWHNQFLFMRSYDKTGLFVLPNYNKDGLYGCKQIFSPTDPCFKDTIDNSKRCVVRNCCKIANDAPIPSYCHC